MAPRTTGRDKRNGIDLLDTSLQAGALVLNIVQQASQYAPTPYLQQAARVTLSIIQMIQAVKDNKADFNRLGNTCASIIAAVWQSYEKSPSKENWPPREMGSVIRDLVETLDDIKEFLEDLGKRSKAIRFLHNVQDRTKIAEYRQRLQDAVAKFEVSSHLNINDILYQLLRENKEIRDMLENQKDDASKVLEKVEQEDERRRREQLEEERMRQDQWEREQMEMRRREEERREMERIQEQKKWEEEKEAEELRKRRAIAEQRRLEEEYKRNSRQETRAEATAKEEAEKEEIYAEIERLRAKQKEFEEKQARLQEKGPRKTKTAWVESEDEEGDLLGEESPEGDTSDEEEFHARKPKSKTKKAGKKKPQSPLQQPPQPRPQQPQQAGLDAQFASMSMGYSPSPGPAYQPSTSYVPQYQHYLPHPYTPPPVSPGIAYPLPTSPYGSPFVQNVNSGNVNWSTISGIGNDYSVNYAAPRRPKRRPNV